MDQRVADALRELVPLVQLGPNSILMGEGLFAGEGGRYYRTRKDDQTLAGKLPRAVSKRFRFEQFLIAALYERIS